MGVTTAVVTPPLMAQHTSWISVDPVRGCPASCAYCYLRPIGLANRVPKTLACTPVSVYGELRRYRFFDKGVFRHAPNPRALPIAIGNYTDMCMTPENRDSLLALLDVHQRIMPEVPICVPTKAVLSGKFLESISRFDTQVVFLISLSFLPPEFERGAPPSEDRLQNFQLLSCFPDLKFIHWWRPITSLGIPTRDSINHQLDLVLQAGATVSAAMGLAYGRRLAEVLGDDDNPLQAHFQSLPELSAPDLSIEPWIREEIIRAAEERSYPVFSGTSCAVSYVLERYCYNARFRKLFVRRNHLARLCPAAQRQRCLEFAGRFPTAPQELLDEVAWSLDVAPDCVSYSEDQETLEYEGVLTQEQQNFLLQATSFPIVARALVKNMEWAEDWRTLASHPTEFRSGGLNGSL